MLSLSLAAPGVATAVEEARSPDLVIASSARQLSAAEVRAHDITDSAAGATALRAAAEAGSVDVNRRPYRVFDFAGQEVIIDAKTPLAARVGLNEAGETIYDVVPTAMPVGATARAGYAVPPASAWAYNNDGSFSTTAGTWKQTVHWTITVAWNYKPCGACTAHQYFRMYGKLIAAVLTGSRPDQGFRRAWIEFDNNGAWGGAPNEFEPPTPEESYKGVNDQTRTFGYGNSFNVSLNVPPLTVGGGASTSYGGSMQKSSENWHPVVRAEKASGGAQWCYYDWFNEYGGTKAIASQVGIRQAVNAQLGGWSILKGMRDDTHNCPSQL